MKKISYLLTVVLALAVAACDNTPRELTELMPDKPYPVLFRRLPALP